MAIISAPLLSSNQETPEVKSFRFDIKGQEISYQAGQFLKLTIEGVDDPRGNFRFFSFASSPTEKDFIMIATKISESPFKKALSNLEIGENVKIDAPFGKFILTDDQSKTHVFLGGGIGITPFRSMIKYATEQKLAHKIVLLYSNQTPEDIVFKEEFDKWAQENQNFTPIYTITKPEESKTKWEGRIGRIDEVMIRKYARNLNNAIFYICGPPGMVDALATLVKSLGISQENLKTEQFTGYQ